MKAVVIFIAFILFFVFTKPALANLLLNYSFEEASSSAPLSWSKNVSTATLGISPTAKTGTTSASINKTNGSTGLIYLYQDVDIEPGSYYSLSGNAVKNSSQFSWVIFRISWRDSSSEISKTDSSQITGNSSDFQSLNIDSVQAPSQAVKARIELAGDITIANPDNPVLFDDIDFHQVEAPDQPTSTPVPTTSTPTTTNTPTPTIIPVTIDVSSDSADVLGDSTQSADIWETAFPTEEISAAPKKQIKFLGKNNFLEIPIALGFILIAAACGILSFRSYKRRKNAI